MKRRIVLLLALIVPSLSVAQDQDARQILSAAGVEGGLVVHLGSGDGRLTAALRADDRYVVHGLDADADNVAKARDYIQSLEMYGSVSVDRLVGPGLPYSDNLVNLLVSEDLGDISMEECLRVLAPKGVALVKTKGVWKKTIKPRPENIDEWTHHLHDAGGNAVAKDRVVGPPRRLRWKAGPLWARSHGWTPSVSAMVSANGRLFYICDETLTGVDSTVPNRWSLVARDAFNGVLFWKCRVPRWGSEAFSGIPDIGRGVTTGRFTMPPHAGKRLVAVGDTVYVTLGPTAPVTALDAASGKRQRDYVETTNADEILVSNGRLIVSINPSEKTGPAVVGKGERPPPAPGKHVLAVDVKTGRLLWKSGPFSGIRASRGQDPFGRLELAAGNGKVFVLTTETIESLDAASGKQLWRIDRPALLESAVRRLGFAGMFEYLLTVMVYSDGVVLLAQPEPNIHHTYHTMPGSLYAFDARDGRQMWKHAYGGWGHCTQPDVFVVDDVVWTHVDAKTEFGTVWGKGFKAKDPSVVNYRIQALDLRTGKVRKELSTRDLFNVGHHHRCYRNKITERFLMSSRRGVEFVDLSTGEQQQHHWIRSGCLLGNLPCNGLLYVTPHACGCYINALLTGFNALAPAASRGEEPIKRSVAATDRLEKGPAYGTVDARDTTRDMFDWPTYRGDSRRSGATELTIGTRLKPAWQSTVGSDPSSLVVADGKVLVADVDGHTVHALDAEKGERIWKYSAGARVDSPPTVHNGLAIFGSADGHVYCLRVSDGALAWRFSAAPRNRLVVSYGQLESSWPVPGSVMIHEGKCWFAAGRSSYLDGGIHLYALDPATGKVVQQDTVSSSDPETGKMSPETRGHAMAGLLNDIPSTDGTNVFIRQMNVTSTDTRVKKRLYTTAGFLDSSWFNRTLWKVGKAQTSGLMVLGKDAAYGVEIYPSRSRETVFKPGVKGYRLRSYPLNPRARDKRQGAKQARKGKQAKELRPTWEQRVGIRITAMIRAADTLFVAGSPDVVDPEDPHGAWAGRKGGVLAAFAAADGRKLAELKLPSPPVWDGMAAADKRLFISLLNGTVICLEETS